MHKPYSEKTGEMIDLEVRKMITGAHERTLKLLMDKKEDVEKVAKMLLEKEVLTREDMMLVASFSFSLFLRFLCHGIVLRLTFVCLIFDVLVVHCLDEDHS